MKKIAIILTLIIGVIFFTGCEENDETATILNIDYVGFETDFQIGVDPSGMASEEVTITVSQASNSDRTFNLSVNEDLTTADASAYSVPSSVTIPANSNIGTFLIDAIGENINSSGEDLLVIEVSTDSDELFKSEPISLNLKQVCPVGETSLDIIFDDWASESSWEIIDSNDTLLFSGGGYADGDASFSTSICLNSGNYTFIINDAFGDGLSSPADGSVIMTQGGVELVSIVGDFGFGTQQGFTIP